MNDYSPDAHSTAELPAGWRRDKIVRLCDSVGSGGTPPTGNPDFYDGNIPWVQTSDLEDGWVKTTSKTITEEGLRHSSARLYERDTLIIAMYGTTIGKLGILTFQAAVNQACCALIGRRTMNVRFMFHKLYSLREQMIAEALGGGQQNIGQETIKQTYIIYIYPPLVEQQRIAAYLDASCAAVDAAVAAKRRQIETLDEILISTIQHAATKGLDQKVETKPSGLDWLPRIPAHWKVLQIKRRCKLLRDKFSHRPRNDPEFYDGEYPFVQTGDITAAEKHIRTYSQTLNELGLSVSRMFPKNTLVMSIAANVGDVAILDFEACFPDSMVGLVPDHHADLHYLYYLMQAMKGILLRSAVLATQLNLNYVRIGTNFVPFPPKDEQQQIAAFLDGKAREIAAVKDMIGQQIETLAYRKSLIHECVTGQRRITETVTSNMMLP